MRPRPILHNYLTFLVAVGSAITLAPAQATIVHSAFDTPAYEDNRSMGGPNLLLAIKTQMPAAGVVTRVEIFTGEREGTNTISIWSHDVAGNQPLTQLGIGSWMMGRHNGWQGAMLTTAVSLQTGQDVWVVWGPQNGAQATSTGTGAGAQPYRGSFTSGATWTGPFQSVQWKFRFWTGTAGHYETYGTGCFGSTGWPALGWSGMPLTGSTFDVHLDYAPANGLAVLSLGLSDTMSNGQALPYSLGSFGAPGCNVLGSLLTTVFVTTDAQGSAVFPIGLPANPAFTGLEFYDQWFCLDATANALGIIVTNGGKAIVGT